MISFPSVKGVPGMPKRQHLARLRRESFRVHPARLAREPRIALARN